MTSVARMALSDDVRTAHEFFSARDRLGDCLRVSAVVSGIVNQLPLSADAVTHITALIS